MSKSKQSGSILLEYSIIASIGLPLLLLGTDIYKTVQIKHALEHGTEQAIRCLKSQNSKCYQNVTLKSEPIYEYRKVIHHNVYPEKIYKHTISAEWLEAPVYQFTEADVTTLDYLDLKKFHKSYSLQTESKTYQYALAYYLKTASSPRIVTGHSKLSALTARHVYSHSRKKTYPHQEFILKIDGSVRKINQIKHIGSFKFRTPKFADLPCYFAKNINHHLSAEQYTENFNKKCSTTSLNTVLQILGNFPEDDQATGSFGKVIMKLSGNTINLNKKNYQRTVSLGSRSFNYQPDKQYNANFVSRGAKLSSISNMHDYPEFSLYQNLILKSDTTYKIDFYIQKLNNLKKKTRWQGYKLKVYYPQFLKKQSRLNCENSACSRTLINNHKVPAALLNKLQISNDTQIQNLGCLSEAEAKKLELSCTNCMLSENSSAQCQGSETLRVKCNKNYGIAKNQEENLQQLIKICDSGDTLNENFLLDKVKQKTETISTDFQYHIKTCNLPRIPKQDSWPAELLKYQRVSLGQPQLTGYLKAGTVKMPVTEFLAKYPEYNCSDIKIKTLENAFPKFSYKGNACHNHLSEMQKAIVKFALPEDVYTDRKEEYLETKYQQQAPAPQCPDILPLIQSEIKDQSCTAESPQCEKVLIGIKQNNSGRHKANLLAAQQVMLKYVNRYLNTDYPLCTKNKSKNCLSSLINSINEGYQLKASLKHSLLSILKTGYIDVAYENFEKSSY